MQTKRLVTACFVLYNKDLLETHHAVYAVYHTLPHVCAHMQVSYCNVACQKMAWEQGSHKKLCKLYRKQQSSANEDWDCATPKSSTDSSQVTLAQQKAES